MKTKRHQKGKVRKYHPRAKTKAQSENRAGDEGKTTSSKSNAKRG